MNARCKYCFQSVSVAGRLCVECRQYYRRDRLWRLHAVFLSDNGKGPFSIASRLNRSAYKEIIPLLIGANRIKAQDWTQYVVEWTKRRGSAEDVDEYDYPDFS